MRKKIVFQLVATFLLGITLGFLISSYFTTRRIQNFSWGRGEVAFWNEALSKIEATEQQKTTIMPIIVRHNEVSRTMFDETAKNIRNLRNSMIEEIKPLLSENQLKQVLKMREEKMRKMREKDGKRSGDKSDHKRYDGKGEPRHGNGLGPKGQNDSIKCKSENDTTKK